MSFIIMLYPSATIHIFCGFISSWLRHKKLKNYVNYQSICFSISVFFTSSLFLNKKVAENSAKANYYDASKLHKIKIFLRNVKVVLFFRKRISRISSFNFTTFLVSKELNVQRNMINIELNAFDAIETRN